ncbi:MAG TPA: undecaprenyl-diphosphate phosphatase, partial [Longimicrobiaceae bacterium]|nr:undecaprenyl-diphosphate phosphatase [Longimicrobiaceae bacterium]
DRPVTGLFLLLKAAILGLVEGATEFIPVSSTGHLIVASEWLNWTDARAHVFIIFIQLPAILAVVWVYRQKIADVVGTLGTRPESRRLAYNIIIGTIPAVVIGLPTDRWVEEHLYTTTTVAVALIVGALVIFWVESWHQKVRVTDVDRMPYGIALGVGIAQVAAVLFPGFSRSAATIMGGVALGLSRVVATEFSFFLAIPAMFGATAVKMWEARDLLTAADIPVFAVGAVVSFLSALVVIRALLRFVSNHDFRGFGWYRLAFGLFLLVLVWQGL